MTRVIKNDQGIAIDGYDVISFFNDSPKMGRSEFQIELLGAKWWFDSRENLDKFRSNPERYKPQYGGNCALAASLNQISPGSPKSWKIKDGKLYLSGNAFAAWLFKVLPGRKEAADKNWRNMR